jgi:hypothetical protein
MGWPMLPSILASAIAARDLGYPTLADTILADEERNSSDATLVSRLKRGHYNLWRLHDRFRPVRELDQCVIPDALHCNYVIQVDVDGL